MPSLAPGNYNGTIAYTEWFKTRSGTVGLNVFVDIPVVGGPPDRLKGTIWVTKKTTVPRTHKDGTPGRSMCEQQLNNCGYAGDMDSIGEIGYTVVLEGNPVRVSVKVDDGQYAQPGDMCIGFFNAKQMRQDSLRDALGSVMGKPQTARATPEGDDDVPAGPPAAPPSSDVPADEADDSVPFERSAGGSMPPPSASADLDPWQEAATTAANLQDWMNRAGFAPEAQQFFTEAGIRGKLMAKTTTVEQLAKFNELAGMFRAQNEPPEGGEPSEAERNAEDLGL